MTGRSISTVPSTSRVIATNEQVTGPVVVELIQRSGILEDTSSDIKVLDNATGGGVLVSELLKRRGTSQISSIVAGDVNEQMLSYTRQRGHTEQWFHTGIRIDTSEVDQESPEFLPTGTFDYVFNNFGVFFSKDDASTLSQTYRLLGLNGKALFATWKSIAWWQSVVVPALQLYLPGAPQLPDPLSSFMGVWNDPHAVESKMTVAGFRNVTTKVYSFMPDVESATFAEACAVLVGVTAKRAWTEEEYSKFGPKIEDALRDYLVTTFPDGKWNGSMLTLITMGEK